MSLSYSRKVWVSVANYDIHRASRWHKEERDPDKDDLRVPCQRRISLSTRSVLTWPIQRMVVGGWSWIMTARVAQGPCPLSPILKEYQDTTRKRLPLVTGEGVGLLLIPILARTTA